MNTLTPLTLLAHDVLANIDHLEDNAWEIAAKAVHTTLDLLFQHGYTAENMSKLLTDEYTRWNKQDDDEIIKEFFG